MIIIINSIVAILIRLIIVACYDYYDVIWATDHTAAGIPPN